VRKAAAEVLSWAEMSTIDIMVNSAGVMLVPECTFTQQGIELHFATNHVGHFLFSCLLMPKLIKAAESAGSKGATRIINVTSDTPTMARSLRWSDMTFEKLNRDLPEVEQPPYQLLELWGFENAQDQAYVPLDAYSRSKIANLLFGIGLNHRVFDKYGILSMAVHPGVVMTELGRHITPEIQASLSKVAAGGAWTFTFKTLGAGAATSLVAALDPKLAEGAGQTREGSKNWGAFLMDCQVSDKAQPLTVSNEEAERLWKLSEELVGQKFAW
jgi:NAD(P)-dependent dehydrogenase (short-subunit alcohol dehydrogenase family)